MYPTPSEKTVGNGALDKVPVKKLYPLLVVPVMSNPTVNWQTFPLLLTLTALTLLLPLLRVSVGTITETGTGEAITAPLGMEETWYCEYVMLQRT